MNFFKKFLFASLPASGSSWGSLNSIDLQKTIRVGIVVFVAAFCKYIVDTGVTDTNLVQVLHDASQAGINGFLASGVELVRRYFSSYISQ